MRLQVALPPFDAERGENVILGRRTPPFARNQRHHHRVRSLGETDRRKTGAGKREISGARVKLQRAMVLDKMLPGSAVIPRDGSYQNLIDIRRRRSRESDGKQSQNA